MDCSICLDELLEDNNDQIYELDCHHKYHKECIRQWLIIKDTCPLCREKINPNKRYIAEEIISIERYQEIFNGLKDWITVLGKGLNYFCHGSSEYIESLNDNEELNESLMNVSQQIESEEWQDFIKSGSKILRTINEKF